VVASTNLGVFGYLPGQPDFVRVRATDREIRRLEDWLERALHQARWEMGGGFAVAYPRLFHRFIFRLDNSDRIVIGVLCASVDCHQRPFPFVAFDLIPTPVWDLAPAALIGCNRAFFSALEQLLRSVGSLAHIGQIHGQVAVAPAATLLADEAAGDGESEARQEARYTNFLQETTCAELGDQAARCGLSLCHELLDMLSQEQDPRQLRQALALPLSRPPFARELELRFYISLLHSLLAAHHPTLTLFWQLGGAEPGSLVVSFREPTLDVFSALIGRAVGRGVCYPGTARMPLSSLRPGLTHATSLNTLLAVIGDKSSRESWNRRENGNHL